MYKRVILIDNEIEWLNVRNILETNEIPLISSQAQGSVFPTLDNNRSLFQLIIPDEYSYKYFKVIEEDYPTRIVKVEETAKKSKTKYWLYLMIAYSLIMSLLFLKYFDISRRNSDDKNFIYKWSLDNTELTLVSKKTQMVHTVYKDKDFDLSYEKSISYGKGKKITEAIDSDENGLYEKEIFFDPNGNYAGEGADKNQDGMREVIVMILENREKLVLEDNDANGIFEIKK